MSDIRHINFQRRRRWGSQSLTLASISGDDTYTSVYVVPQDFLATEARDESGSDRGLSPGEPLFEFRIYNRSEVQSFDLDSFNLVLFAGVRYEIQTKERKNFRRAYIEITARPIGTV